MTPQQIRRVRDLFDAALDHAPADRSAWIAHAASDDAAVREEVLSLLESDARAGSFLEEPALDRLPHLMADATLAAGTVVGPYTIVREIGRGGMGVVYLASDGRLDRIVALKALAPHLTRDESQRDRLRFEARSAAGLAHPGICTVYALEEIDGAVYIATEFVDGATLRAEMQSARRPSAAEIVRTARELASALASAHDRGITHRDLKPENVMRTSDGRLKILDFGLARSTASSAGTLPRTTIAGGLIGTPAYMAPEQLRGEAVDRRADIFAVGVLLYEYASGVHPFAADSPAVVGVRARDASPAPLASRRSDLPAGVIHAIDRCLRPLPADRYQSASELVGALDRTDAVEPPANATWWRIHQCVVAALYLAAAVVAWQLKEWVKTPATTSIFIALGVAATIGCVLRGHTLFTEGVNRAALDAERRRTAGAVLAVDAALAIGLLLDAVFFVSRPLVSVLTMSLAAGIVLAAALIEPATARAAFGDADRRSRTAPGST